MQIVVLGMHRSGTSALTRIINLMGAYFGPEHLHLGANQHNPKGYWERTDVISINEQILAAAGCTWYRPVSTDISALSLPPQIDAAIARLVLGLDAHRPWVIKDPRLCLTAAHWLKHLDHPLVVICSRNPQSVAASLNTRDNMPYEYGMALWEHYAVSLIKASYPVPKIHIRYEDIVSAPIETVSALYEKLKNHGVPAIRNPSAQELTTFVNSQTQEATDPTSTSLTDGQIGIQAMLHGDTPADINIEPTEASKDILARVNRGPLIG